MCHVGASTPTLLLYRFFRSRRPFTLSLLFQIFVGTTTRDYFTNPLSFVRDNHFSLLSFSLAEKTFAHPIEREREHDREVSPRALRERIDRSPQITLASRLTAVD